MESRKSVSRAAVLVDSGETSVWAPYWILAEERLRKSEKATGARGAGGDFVRERPGLSVVKSSPLPSPSSLLEEEARCNSLIL